MKVANNGDLILRDQSDLKDTEDNINQACVRNGNNGMSQRQSKNMNWTESAREHFGSDRPELFTDVTHCPECRDHNETLANSDVDTIGMDELGNPAWDPMCFVNDAGYRYYFPALVQLCVDSDADDYYIGQFLFQLTYDGEHNRHLACFNSAQKSFVRDFCLYLLAEKIDQIQLNGDEDLLAQALSLWGAM